MPALSNTLMRRTETTLPIWQAPLPFDLINAAMAGRISALGALGMIRVGAHSNSASLSADISAYTAYHTKPSFCFYHRLAHPDDSRLDEETVHSIYHQVGLTPGHCPAATPFTTLLEQAIEAGPRTIGFAHGLPHKADLEHIREHHIPTFAICHNVCEAVVAEDHGIDYIIIQGHEAGGLHSRFPNTLPPCPQTAMGLLSQTRNLVNIPIIVWGDFPSGSDVIAALIAGAQAVMIDRPLLSNNDSGLSEAQQQQLAEQNEVHSTLSDQFSTLPMRLLPNTLQQQLYSDDPHRERILHEILRRNPDWRPLCVSVTACPGYPDLAACLDAYRQDMTLYLA